MAGIEGKVIRVLSSTEVVINRGSEHGIHSGSRFLIFVLGDEIRDPDTGESLGQLEVVRGKAKVKHCQAKITTLESSETKSIKQDRTRIDKTDPIRSSFSIFPLLETVTEDIEVQAEFNNVMVGDLVREI